MDDYYGNDRGNNKWGGGGGSNYNNPNNYNSRYDEPQGYDDGNSSATGKLYTNSGRQPGLGGRRKFVPPTKNSSDGNSCNNGSFNPGRSVQ